MDLLLVKQFFVIVYKLRNNNNSDDDVINNDFLVDCRNNNIDKSIDDYADCSDINNRQ